MSLKFIHSADLHIDSPMRGLGETDPDVAERIRLTTRRALENLVERAIAENVAFVVVAGDVFDGDWDDLATGLWTIRQFRRLEERKIPIFIVYGNHDRQNKTLRNLVWPSNVKVFSAKTPETFVYPDDLPTLFGKNAVESSNFATTERVALTGQSYSANFCSENLAANFPAPVPNAFNIGVLHTDLSGDGADSHYAPTGIETLTSKRYNYWALGHVHQRQTAQVSPCWIGFSGVLQGRHIRETEPKGFYVVEIEDGATTRPEPEFVAADSLRWFALDVDLSNIATEEDFQTKFVDSMQKIVENAEERFAAVRVSLVGRTILHRTLKKERAEQTLVGKLRSWTSDLHDAVWIEELELKTEPPRAATLGTTGLLGDLAKDFERKIAGYSDAATSEKKPDETPKPQGTTGTLFDVESEDARLLADLKKRVGPYLSELRVDLDDPATLRRWNEEARELLTDAFADDAE